MSILIKRLTREDWQIFKELRVQMLTEEPQAYTTTLSQVLAYTDEEWKKRTAGERTAVLVLFVNGKPAGMNGFYYDDKGELMIWGMFVKKEFRGKGLGKRLMDGIEKEIQKDDTVKKINICVKSCQIPAWELYKKQGFKEVARDKDQKNENGDVYDEIHMEKAVL